MRHRVLWLLLLGMTASTAVAQRQMESLGRGVVAIRSTTSQAYVSWRLLAEDPSDVRFNVLRSANGGAPQQINVNAVTNTTDFIDTTANFSVSNAWFVQAISGGATQSLSAPFGLAANVPVRQYIPLPLQPVAGGAHPPYDVKFCWVGDLDGDGEYDFVVDRHSTTAANVRQYLQAYKRDGTFLWQIDMGYNSTNTSGNSTITYEPSASAISVGDKDNVTVYDMDGDGRAEVLLRTANGVVFGDGTVLTGGASDNVQFLSVVDGLTGMELARGTVPNPFIADGPLNFHAGILYGDGVRPYVFLDGENRVGTGPFQRLAAAWTWQNGQLIQQWFRAVPNNVNESRGHQVRIADVNHDGRDDLIEIGSAYNGATGQPLYDTEVVHGDRYHVTDLDPDRPGLETYVIQQNNPTLLATALIESGTGQLYRKWYSEGIVDVGRGDALDMDPRYRGVEVFSTQPGIYTARGEQIPGATPPFPALGIWWDADLQREILGASDGNGFNPVINKWTAVANSAQRLYSVYMEGVHTAFGGRPTMFGDLVGDWREEFVVVANDYSELRLYITKIPATNRLYCLMQNPAYRVQCTVKGYYQASYPDYYLGEQMLPPTPPPRVQSHLVWRGSAGADWDTVSANWRTNRLGIFNPPPVPFASGNTVLFDLTGSNAAPIRLVGDLAPGKVTVHSPNNYTFTGPGRWTGPMELVKAGGGSLVLEGTNAFTGATTVWEGALIVNGGLGASPVTVHGGVWHDGAIGGNGWIGGAVTVHRNASILPGYNGVGTLVLSNGLTLIDGAVARFELGSDPNGVLEPNDRIQVVGNVTLSGTNRIHVTPFGGQLSPGVYPLITYTGTLNGGLNQWRIEGLDGLSVMVTNPPGQIALLVRPVRPAQVVTWTGGSNGNAWDLTSSNWLNGVERDVFVPNDTARFNQVGASNPVIHLTEPLAASDVLFDSTTDYTLTGVGALIGSGMLTKSNSGTLTINVLQNNFTGRTRIAGGTVVVPKLDAIGYPSPLGNPPGGSDQLILSGNSTLRITGESYTDRGFTISSGTDTIDVANGTDQVTVAGRIVGAGTLRKLGSGTLALTVSNAHSGGTIIEQGVVSLGSEDGNRFGVGPGGVVLNGGRLSMIDIRASELCAWSIRVPAGASGRLDCDGRCTLSGPLTGGGDLTVYVPYVRTDFSGTWSGFTGRLAVVTGSGGGNFRCINAAGYPNARMDLGVRVSLQNRVSGTPTISIGELSGAAGSDLSAPGGNDGIPVIWRVGGLNSSATFAGNTLNGIGLIKVGTGTWTLSGTNVAHTGTTTVSGGALRINGDARRATGNVTVETGGTLEGVGTIGGRTTVNGRLAPGSGGIGALTFITNLTLAASSTTVVELNKALGVCDRMNVAGILTLGGRLSVTNLNGTLVVGDVFKVIDTSKCQGAFAVIDLPPLPPNLRWSTSRLTTDGTLRVLSAVPPTFGTGRVEGTDLIFSGSGGTPGENYYLLSATNLTLPMDQWSRLMTNPFGPTGEFQVTNTITPGLPGRFFRLQLE